jgi:hypothetical protein
LADNPFLSFGSIVLGFNDLRKDAMAAGFVYLIISAIVLEIKYSEVIQQAKKSVEPKI